MQSYKLLILIGGLSVVGCNDAVTDASSSSPDLDLTIPEWLATSGLEPRDSSRIGMIVRSDTPEALPEEFQGETSLDLVVDAGVWEGFMRGDAIAYYWGTHAEVALDLKLLNGLTEMGSIHQRSAESDLFPASRSLGANAEYYLEPTCGYGVRAVGVGSVWNNAFLSMKWLDWGRKSRSGQDTANQPACTGSTGGGGGGGYDDKGSGLKLEVCYYTAEFIGPIVYIHEHSCYTYNLREYAM